MKHKYRFIKRIGSDYEVRFVKGRPIKKDGKELLEVGTFKKKYYPYISEMTDYDENGNPIEQRISEGLHIDVPIDVLRWNVIMKSNAIAEHTQPSWFTEYKPLIFTFGFAVLVFVGMLWIGSGVDNVVNSSQIWMNSMDKFMGVI